jgi:hypothetical protein
MPRVMIEQMTAAINQEIAKPSPDFPRVAHDALRIIYCCLSKMRLSQEEVEKAVSDLEFVISLGGGKIRKSLTAAGPFESKPEPCEPPKGVAQTG